jgi:hypothetical protein
VDSEGVIRAKLFENGYQTRHSTDALITAVKSLKENSSPVRRP